MTNKEKRKDREPSEKAADIVKTNQELEKEFGARRMTSTFRQRRTHQ